MKLLHALDRVIETASYGLQQGFSMSAMDREWTEVEKAVQLTQGQSTNFGRDVGDFFGQFLTAIPKRHTSLAETYTTSTIMFQIGTTAEALRDLLTLAEVDEKDDPDYHSSIIARERENDIDFPGERSPIAKLGEKTIAYVKGKGITMQSMTADQYRRAFSISHVSILHSINDDRRTAVAFASAQSDVRSEVDKAPKKMKICNREFPMLLGPQTNLLIIKRIGLGTTFTRQKLAVHLAAEMLEAAQLRAAGLKVDLQ